MPYIYEFTALGSVLLCRHNTSRLVVTAHYTRDVGHNFGTCDHSFITWRAWMVNVSATYSLSAVGSTIGCCFLVVHATGELLNFITLPVVDLRSH